MQPKHLLTGEEFTSAEISTLLTTALMLKKERLPEQSSQALSGYHLALLFDKPSLRTRFSFTVAMRELGGDVVESLDGTRKIETPEDQAGVLSGYCHGIMYRTHDDATLTRMSTKSKVPIINGLSALHHPCQIFSDFLTLVENFGCLQGLNLCYIGDGNNILHSFLLNAPQMGINIRYCCPKERSPDATILAKSLQKLKMGTGSIEAFSTPEEAVATSHVVYTDVWTSMGFANQDDLFAGFQITEELMEKAASNAIFMHCLPMNRGKEVSETLPDQPCSVIYQQSENRLHMQKALLLYLLKNEV